MRSPLLAFVIIASLLSAAPASASFNHGSFDAILRAHVHHGRVSYSGIRQKAKAKLVAYVKAIGAANLRGMSRDQRLAFYLNAYNATVILAVVDRPGIRSVMKVAGFFDKIRHRFAGRSLTLNGLENKVIRPEFHEPRIHFALVCAAKSCPPLQSRAFTARRLQADLHRLAASFIGGGGVRIQGGKATISKLFQWYAKDFVAAAGSVGAFLARYRKKDATLLERGAFQYQRYDWSLNGR